MKNYVLINCGLIHQYLVRKEDIQKTEDETLYTVEIIKNLSTYRIESKEHKLILSNGSERLVFKMVENCKGDIFKYFLDEFKNCESKKSNRN